MEVNKDVIKGYSVCWYRGMITMRSHLEGENVDFYEQMQKTKTGAVWLHLPVVRDEKLFQIWIMDTKGLFGLVMAVSDFISFFLFFHPIFRASSR